MIPVQDVIPCRTRPWVTFGILACTFAGLAAEWWLPAPVTLGLSYRFGFVPLEPQWSNLAASVLFHTGLVHAASNMMTLWVFGATLEDRFGHARFLGLYFASAAVGALAVRWALPFSTTPILGAGAAVAGVIAAYLLLFPRSRVMLLIPLPGLLDLVEVPAWLMPGFWFLLQVAGTVTPGNSGTAVATLVWQTLGGAIVGLLGARWAVKRERLRVEWWGD